MHLINVVYLNLNTLQGILPLSTTSNVPVRIYPKSIVRIKLKSLQIFCLKRPVSKLKSNTAPELTCL